MESDLAAIVRQNPNARELHFDLIDVSDLSPLKGLTDLEVLSVTNCNGKLIDLTPLKNLTKLRELNLLHHEYLRDISPLSALVNLEILDLTNCVAEDLSALSGLSKLRKLSITVPATDLRPISHLPLHELYIGCNNSEIDYSPLGQLGSLKKLTLRVNCGIDHNEQINPYDLSYIAKLPLLEELDCGILIEDYSFLESCASLQQLTVTNRNGKLIDLAPLKNLTKLRELDLSDHENIKDIEPLSSLVNLETLNLTNCGIDDISPLQKLDKLRNLSISVKSVIDYSPLDRLTSLKKLYLHVKWSIDQDQLVQPFDLSYIAKLPQLEELDCYLLITDYTFLESCTSLKKLNIPCDNLQELYSFRNLTALQELSIPCSRHLLTTNYLDRLTNLQILKLSHTPELTDISALAKCSQLRSLSIMLSKLSDISILSGLSNLENLELKHCNNLNNLGNFSQNYNLKILWIERGTFSDISGIANLKSLKTLILGSCSNVTDISAIAELPNLRVLCLNDSKSIKHIQPIKGVINQLDDLELDSCFFDDAPGLLVGFESNAADDAREYFGFPRRQPARHDYEGE